MIYGIGVDLVEVARIKLTYEKFGKRFIERVLTDFEQSEFESRDQSIRYLATRFAAKEAASKALGKGIADGISFRSIEVRNDQAGKPLLRFYDACNEFSKEKNIVNYHLSISDEEKVVVAMVLLESV